MKVRSATSPRPRPKRPLGRALAVAGAAVLTGLLAAAGLSGTPRTGETPAKAVEAAVAPVAAEAPGYAVEDFDYPGADKILEEQGITLKRGDGHIVLATCDSETGLLEVWARSRSNERICFRVTGNSGYLSLEIPSVYGVQGNAYATTVDMTVEDEEKSFDITKNTWTPVGESVDDEAREHMLVEITTTK
ncbi:hypothetical protein [Streptomyces sp. NPDC058653]|uniref:hypothetical protein n=1 Tax=Streptomyces sp. NPDC058653 TaxID=3346576 RepID=UPI0036520693